MEHDKFLCNLFLFIFILFNSVEFSNTLFVPKEAILSEGLKKKKKKERERERERERDI